MRKSMLLLTLVIVASMYFGCAYVFRYPFVGMLPSEFEAQSAAFVDDNCAGGVAVFELPETQRKEILAKGEAFFDRDMRPRIQRRPEDFYLPWKRTPLPPSWTNAELAQNAWAGLSCSMNVPVIKEIIAAGWRTGGFYTSLNRGYPLIVAFPELGLVVISYSSL